jgi:hypothetical protein
VYLPLAYHITFGTYGTRLHGDDRGTVDQAHNFYGDLIAEKDEDWQQIEHAGPSSCFMSSGFTLRHSALRPRDQNPTAPRKKSKTISTQIPRKADRQDAKDAKVGGFVLPWARWMVRRGAPGRIRAK